MTKTCRLCGDEKPKEDFYQFYDKWSNKKYFSARCKPCHQKYKANNPNRPRNNKAEKLKLRYGLSYEEWERIREKENYSCMICGIAEGEMDRKLDVDHCHITGKVRGVLCSHCNNILGKAKDNVEILASAIKYLKVNGGGYRD